MTAILVLAIIGVIAFWVVLKVATLVMNKTSRQEIDGAMKKVVKTLTTQLDKKDWE